MSVDMTKLASFKKDNTSFYTDETNYFMGNYTGIWNAATIEDADTTIKRGLNTMDLGNFIYDVKHSMYQSDYVMKRKGIEALLVGRDTLTPQDVEAGVGLIEGRKFMGKRMGKLMLAMMRLSETRNPDYKIYIPTNPMKPLMIQVVGTDWYGVLSIIRSY